MATGTTPDKYSRPDPYLSYLDKQKQDEIKKKADAATAAALAEKNASISSAKTEEARAKAIMNDAQTKFAAAEKAYYDYDAYIFRGGRTPTELELSGLRALGLTMANARTELNLDIQSYSKANQARIDIEKKYAPPPPPPAKKIVTPSGSNSNTAGNISTAPKIPNPLVYYYNAPMINTNYLSISGPQQSSRDRSIGAPVDLLSATDSWKEDYMSARGVIQMDSTQVFNNANYANKDTGNYDGNLYGFKFLYNPSEVNMTWAVAEGMNWEGIQAGLDPGTAPTSALNNSTISFSLLLNRIHDMGYLDSNGLKAGVTNPYPEFRVPPGTDRNKELALIYEKGTMYDLEYLFKSIAGLNATFNTAFNDVSADVGWLYGFQVELHLGSKLRYKVRLTGLDVTHQMFNDKMVPILSQVNLSFARFPNINPPKG